MAGQLDRVLDPLGIDSGLTATLAAYWSGVSICSSRLPSWTSPQVPRVLTLVSTRLRSPMPLASDCISPKPLVDGVEPVADQPEALAEAGLERGLELLVDGGPHLLPADAAFSVRRAVSCRSTPLRARSMPCWVVLRQPGQADGEAVEPLALDGDQVGQAGLERVGQRVQPVEQFLAELPRRDGRPPLGRGPAPPAAARSARSDCPSRWLRRPRQQRPARPPGRPPTPPPPRRPRSARHPWGGSVRQSEHGRPGRRRRSGRSVQLPSPRCTRPPQAGSR